MSEPESQRETEGQDGEDREVESAAPADESKVVGEGAEVPPGEGEEADEGGVEGGAAKTGSGADDEEPGDRDRDRAERSDDGPEDNRDELAREIESDPASNPDDPMLKDIKGG